MIKNTLQTLTLIGSWILTLGAAADTASATKALAADSSYLAAEEYKAQVTLSTDPSQQYTSTGQPNRLAATTSAIAACLQAHPEQNHDAGYCEVVRMGDNAVSTSQQIKSAVPNTNHPLFLWKYHSSKATVYLAGSIHVLKPALYPLPAQFDHAFDLADYLVLEIDPNGLPPQEMQFKVMQYGMLEDQSLDAVLAPELYAGLGKVTAEYGLPIAQLGQFKPSFITQQVAVMALMSAGYDPTQGLEMYFLDRSAKDTNPKQVLELETVDFQLDLLMNQPMPVQVKMVEEMIEQIPGFESLTAQMITAWLSGDDASFERAFSDQASASAETKEFMRQLMDQRNVGMANKIEAFLKTEGTYFVLVGAGHYVGTNNIIELLQKKGLAGQRIFSKHSLTR